MNAELGKINQAKDFIRNNSTAAYNEAMRKGKIYYDKGKNALKGICGYQTTQEDVRKSANQKEKGTLHSGQDSTMMMSASSTSSSNRNMGEEKKE